MTLGCTGRWTGYLTAIILMEELASSHRLRALDLALYHAVEYGRGDTFQRIKKYIGLRRALRSVVGGQHYKDSVQGQEVKWTVGTDGLVRA